MDEKGLVAINNGIAISGDIKIGMSEMVSVGVARMERRFKMNIKSLKEEVVVLNQELADKTEAINPLVEKAIPKEIIDANDTLQKTLDTIDIVKGVKIDYSAIINHTTKNIDYSLKIISKKSGWGNQETLLASGKCPFTKELIVAHRGIDAIYEILKEKQTAIMNLTRKMNDVSFLERQLKARLVEDQLNKSEDGKSLLNSAVSQFEEDLDLLG